ARADAAARAGHAEQDAQTARGELETVRSQNAELREQLAAAQATASSVQTAMDAVLARITTPEPPTGGGNHENKA
ncbi:hypothetical protein, partial [Arthrobacter sp. H14]|uniref:hypothetical protein n=1 Tax=Arthrobacter sp. H14 TaxID=1312959 RepID=UPI00055A189C